MKITWQKDFNKADTMMSKADKYTGRKICFVGDFPNEPGIAFITRQLYADEK
jgi:hypothetical protein